MLVDQVMLGHRWEIAHHCLRGCDYVSIPPFVFMWYNCRRGYCTKPQRTWQSNIRVHNLVCIAYDDIIKWKHFPRYWPFVPGIHRSPVNSPHKAQWRGALMFSLIWAWMNGCENNREVGDSRRHRAHYDVTVMGVHCIVAEVDYYPGSLALRQALSWARLATYHHIWRGVYIPMHNYLQFPMDTYNIPWIMHSIAKRFTNTAIYNLMKSPDICTAAMTVEFGIIYLFYDF